MATVAEVRKRILRDVGRAVTDHGMIADGDKIMVAVSGGKDSYAMLEVLRVLQSRAPVRFDLVAIHLDQGQPGYDGRGLQAWLQSEGYAYEILREDTYAVVTERMPTGGTYCSLCSRLRRGILYTAAERLGCHKIALGHHRDDAIETLLLNVLFSGRVAAMPGKLVSDDGRNVVIRPLINVPEDTLMEYARLRDFPIVPCKLCGSQDGAQRQRVKALLAGLEQEHPGVKSSVFASLSNVRPSQLLDPHLAPRPEDIRETDHGAKLVQKFGGGSRLRVLAHDD